MQTTTEFHHHVPVPLRKLRVAEAMHPGMIACPPDTPLRSVARMMATYRVHAIVVHAHDEELLPGGAHWGVVTDTALLRTALGDLDDLTAGDVATSPVLSVMTSLPLAAAAEAMVEHDVSHLVVVEGRSGRPVGVVSTLDVARALAGLS